MLEKEFKYYLTNQQTLLEKYKGKYIVIKDQQVVGSYNTHAAAYDECAKKFELGTFLIQLCLPGEGSYSQTFHSRVLVVNSN